MLPQTHTFASMSRVGMPQLAAQSILQHAAITSSHSRCWMGVQGEKHHAPALFKCRPCCLVNSSSPEQRCWILGCCRVLVGGGEINVQSGVPATWLLHPTHGVWVTLAVVPAGRGSWQHGADLPDGTAWGGCDKPCCLQWHCPKPGAPH